MRKKEYKLKHKIKYCVVNYHNRFDRHFVKKEWNDAQFIPFCKTSRDDPYDDYDHAYYSQKKMRKYLKRWLLKRINKTFDEVYSEYVRLGWRNRREMDIIWNSVVFNGVHEISRFHWKYCTGFYIDSDNIFRLKKRGLPN